jgi:hypothetical protein
VDQATGYQWSGCAPILRRSKLGVVTGLRSSIRARPGGRLSHWCRGMPRAAKWKIQKHPSPSNAGSDAQATRLELAGGCRRSQSAPPGHPARARYIVEAGLLARGSLFESVFPGSRPVTPMDSGSPLTVAGAAPLSLSNVTTSGSLAASLLAPSNEIRRRPRQSEYGRLDQRVKGLSLAAPASAMRQEGCNFCLPLHRVLAHTS